MANRAVCSDLARIQVSKSVYQFPHSVNSLVTILSTIQCYFSHKYTKGKFSSPPLGAWALLKPGTHKAICRSICHFEANCMTNHPYRIVCILKFCSCSTFTLSFNISWGPTVAFCFISSSENKSLTLVSSGGSSVFPSPPFSNLHFLSPLPFVDPFPSLSPLKKICIRWNNTASISSMIICLGL